jgi:hypothetical protein
MSHFGLLASLYLYKSNDQACKNNQQEQLDGQMHRIRSKMIAKGREYCGYRCYLQATA